jgi:hypothetical protein
LKSFKIPLDNAIAMVYNGYISKAVAQQNKLMEGKIMEIKELVRICKIEDAKDGSLKIWNIDDGKIHLSEIKAKKPEILAYLAEQETQKEKAHKEREDKINAIEGLNEIQRAIDAEIEYGRAFDHMMEDEDNDGAFPPSKPVANSGELKKQYPRASAYLKAESWSYADHYAKSGAGRRAMERIIESEDYTVVLADMEKEWSAHCEEHIWD